MCLSSYSVSQLFKEVNKQNLFFFLNGKARIEEELMNLASGDHFCRLSLKSKCGHGMIEFLVQSK